MRGLGSRSRVKAHAALVAGVAMAALAAGCGGSKEAGSARELDEARAYGRVVVRSEVSPRRVTLGDPVVWTLSATLPATCVPMGVQVAPSPSSLEIVPRGPADVRPARDAIVWRRVYDLRGFDLGSLPLPEAVLSVRVRGPNAAFYGDTLLFPADSLAVDSLTPAPTGILAPDRGPVDPGARPVDVAVAVGLGLLVLGAIVALILAWRRGRERPAPTTPAEPPEVSFARALDALRREGATLPRDEFHDRLSDAIRRYVTAAAGVDAIDRTTRELEREMRRSPRIPSEAAAEVSRILLRSDLVKFARRADAWEEARALLDDAGRLSGSITIAIAPTTAAPPAGPPAARPDGGD